MPAPRGIIELVERFERNRDAYRSNEYNETETRCELIDPFFSRLSVGGYNGVARENRAVRLVMQLGITREFDASNNDVS